MSYSNQPHPLASLSSAAAAAASALPVPILNPPERSSSQSSSPAQAYHPHSHGTDSQNHAIQQYYSHGHHGSAAGGGGIVNSPDSIPSPHVNSSSAGGGGSASKATGRKRKASQGGPGAGGSKEDDKDSGKKRQVVSCGECKRRKIKCSRTHPCLACCKRGEPEACRWDQESMPPKEDTQPFAISSDLVLLAERVQALERWAKSLPEDLSSTAPEVQGFSLTYYGNKTKKAKQGGKNDHDHQQHDGSSVAGTATREGTESPARGMSVEREERRSIPLGDTEDAVIKLESVAFDQRLPGSRYRPVDSLPFFDNIPNARMLSSQSSSSSSHRRTKSTVAQLPETDTYAHELTSAKTSIIAFPLSFEGPYSGPSLGLPIVGSLEELRDAKKREMDSMFKMLPERELSTQLIERYFREVDWLMNILFEPIFKAEHERYWEMREAGRGEEIDPLWIACYCMVLALGVDGLRCETPKNPPTFEERRMYRPAWWYGCALRLMKLGDAEGRPQIRFIQVAILIGQWLAFAPTGGHASRCLSFLGSAVRTAQILGLHQMSNDPSQMPPPDPAWPPHANSIKREGAIRLFGFLIFLDYMSATTRFRSYLLDPLQCTTPPVSNVNLSELSATEWRLQPQPRNVYTDGSFEWAKRRVAQVSREAYARLVLQPATFTYEIVLELDTKFRRALEEISAALPAEGATTRPQQWKRLVCLEGVHSRLVRMHRPFLLKKDYSRKCCLESAEIVIKSQLQIQKWTNSIWFVYAHSLAAATALFADLFDAIDHDLPERQIEAKKETLVLAFEIFSKHDEIPSPHLRQIVQTGSKILSGLFMAEEKRRVTRAASALVPNSNHGGKSSTPPESFAQVLQRLTLELDIPRTVLPSPAPVASRPLHPVPSNATDYINSSTATSSSMPYPPTSANYLLPPSNQSMDPSYDFNLPSAPTNNTGGGFNNAHALPGMVGNESSLSSSDFWKDGLGLGFGVGVGPNAQDFSSMTGTLPGSVGNVFSGMGVGSGSNGGMGTMGGGTGVGMDLNTSVFDFWDLSTPQPSTTNSNLPSTQQDYMMGGGGAAVGGGGSSGYDWSQNNNVNSGGENRRAAEVMADQLMSSGW
ncbi:hypothetical protein JCM3765_004155 [Sporobolomyces pararoseus]